MILAALSRSSGGPAPPAPCPVLVACAAVRMLSCGAAACPPPPAFLSSTSRSRHWPSSSSWPGARAAGSVSARPARARSVEPSRPSIECIHTGVGSVSLVSSSPQSWVPQPCQRSCEAIGRRRALSQCRPCAPTRASMPAPRSAPIRLARSWYYFLRWWLASIPPVR